MRSRRLGRLIVPVVLAVLLVQATPASADRIPGTSGWDPGNHWLGPIGWYGNYVAFWQNVLRSDQFEMDLCGGTGIDGDFGPHTEWVTSLWQSRHGNRDGASGQVRNETWAQADLYSDTVWYYGRYDWVRITDGTGGLWFINMVDGNWQASDHPDLYFTPC
jgi:hypothetical protein